jgi:adenine-specific DNA-methyltransferase
MTIFNSDQFHIASHFDADAPAVVYPGDCIELLSSIPTGKLSLIVTSPPYNIGKAYEKRLNLRDYVAQQRAVVELCVEKLAPDGHICWQVGNYVDNGQIIPLDTLLYPVFAEFGLQLRNRIVWHFEHGLHCTRRFSGRYETINWFTKTDDYYFDVDPVRVPQKYPGKRHFKGPRAGQYSANPLGKNPGDVWIFPNVKSNHVEKTDHPCQFPIELVERLILSMTKTGQWVFDPFLGVGTTVAAAILNDRRGAGAEIKREYVATAKKRIAAAATGELPHRPRTRPVFDPKDAGAKLTTAPWGEHAALFSDKG